MPLIELTQSAPVFSTPRFSFARNCLTADPLGNQIAANVPRFAAAGAVAGQLGPSQTVLAGLGTSPMTYSGKDLLGGTLCVILDNSGSNRRMRVLTEDTPESNVWTTRTTVNLARPAAGMSGNIGDVRGKAGVNGVDDGLCYLPRACSIVHGTIVFFCEIYVRTSGTYDNWLTYQTRGIGVACSIDYGATFPYTWDDSASSFNPGKARGTGWSLGCNYYCPFQVDGTPFLEAWISAVDYQFANGSGSPELPMGGTVVWFRLDRATVVDRFIPVNVANTCTVGRDNLNITSTALSGIYSQRQGCALFKASSTTLGVLIAESDSRWSSITRLTNISRTDYAAGGYTTQKNWHGFIDTEVQKNSAWPTFTGSISSASSTLTVNANGTALGATWNRYIADYSSLIGTTVRVVGAGVAGADLVAQVSAYNEAGPSMTLTTAASTTVASVTCHVQVRGDYSSGNQFVACGPGPDAGEVLLGGDAVLGTVDIVDATATRCRHETVWGGHSDERELADATVTSPTFQRWGDQRLFLATLWYDAPEKLTGRVVIGVLQRGNQIATADPVNVDAFIISRDSGRKGTWAVMHWPNQSEYGVGSIGLHCANEYLYATTASSVVRFKLPGVVAGRALEVGPGQTNYVPDQFGGPLGGYDSDSPNNFQRCPKVNGKFQRVAMAGDGSGQAAGTALGDLDPQPPIQHDPTNANSGNVYRLIGRRLKTGVAGPLPSTNNVMANFPIFTKRGSGESEFTGTLGWGAAFTGWFKWRVFMLNATDQAESFPIASGRSPCIGLVPIRWEAYGGTNPLPYTGPSFTQASNDKWHAVRSQRLHTAAWNANSGSAVLMTPLTGANKDKEDIDHYIAFDSVSLGNADYGYPQPRALSGGTANNSVIVPATNPNEVAKISDLGLGGGASFTLILTGKVAEHCWDHFTFRDVTNIDWPIATLYGDSNTSLTVAPSPFTTTSSGSPSYTINRTAALRSTIRSGGADTAVKDMNDATFLANEGLIVVIRFNALTNLITIDAVNGGRRLATQTSTEVLWAGITFNELRFSNRDQSVVNSFDWFSVWTENRLLSDADVDSELTSMAFAEGGTAGGFIRDAGDSRTRECWRP